MNLAADHRWQFHYDSSQFQVQGPITIIEMWVRASTPTVTVAAFSFPSVVITLSSSPTDYSVAGTPTQPGHSPIFAINVGPDATVVRTGPWTGGPVGPSLTPSATWIPFGLTGTFAYDASFGLDLLVEIVQCGAGTLWGTSLDGPSGSAGTVMGNRYGVTSSCVATTSTLQNNEFVPVIRIDYLVGGLPGGLYQVNQPGASLDVDSVFGTQVTPAMVTVSSTQPSMATITSTELGQSWEVGIGMLPLVPAGGGALALPDGQLLNLNPVDPALILLWNGFASPPFTNSQFPVLFGPPGTLSIQVAVISPASITGVALSQPVQLTVQ